MPRKPNLLFIYTDEQRYDTLACYGNRQIAMPNLNRFAAESVVFDRAYVTQTVCTPSRSSILTGLYPHTTGCTENNIPLPADALCLPEMVHAGDYVTGHFGKWHLGDEVFPQHGFSEWRSIEDEYRAYYAPGRDVRTHSTYHHFLVEQGFRPDKGDLFSRWACAGLPEEFGKPAYLAGEAARFIRENRNRPFILFVNFLEPHMPFTSPRNSQYSPETVPLPPNFAHPPGAASPLKARLAHRACFENGHSGLPLKTEADWRRMIARYWGLCSLVDAHAGRIIAALDECGLRDDTLVVFTSDHGDMMGSHQLLTKCVNYEEAARVPLLVRMPGQRTGRRIAGPVSHADLVPTILDLLEQDVPGHLQGRSRAALLRSGGGARLTDDVIVEWNGANCLAGNDRPGGAGLPEHLPPWLSEFGSPDRLAQAICDPVRAILTGDGWKFCCSPIGEHELYDLNADPFETRNLAFEDASRPRMRELRERLGAWQKCAKDAVVLPVI